MTRPKSKTRCPTCGQLPPKDGAERRGNIAKLAYIAYRILRIFTNRETEIFDESDVTVEREPSAAIGLEPEALFSDLEAKQKE